MQSTEDTIVAIATPLGEGGLGVVRLSGSDAIAIASRLFKSKQNLSNVPTHTLHHGWLSSPRSGECREGIPLDEAVAAVFKAPHSYTGENVVEFSCHGSPLVLKELVRQCEASGARQAQPGEFTQRAYLNGKLDLPQAEAVAALIHAQSSKARAAATDQLRGQLSIKINSFRDRLIDILAQVEANLDFAEEEVPIIAREKIAAALKSVASDLQDLLGTSLRGRLLRDGIRVALAGQPNVGKSSLFNALLAQDRAIVTNVPGTTRDTLEEKMEWDGYPVVLIDTAGMRATIDAVEAEGTARAARAHNEADVVLFVLDGSQPLSADDERVKASLAGKNVIAVLNKMDCGLAVDPRAFPGAVATCAKDGRGLPELKNKILALIGVTTRESEATVSVTHERHLRHLENAQKRVITAREATIAGSPEESFALDLRAALEELGAITGESVTEDVLSSIFKQFCIGK